MLEKVKEKQKNNIFFYGRNNIINYNMNKTRKNV